MKPEVHLKKTEEVTCRTVSRLHLYFTPSTLFKCSVIIIKAFDCTLLYTLLLVFFNEFINEIIQNDRKQQREIHI